MSGPLKEYRDVPVILDLGKIILFVVGRNNKEGGFVDIVLRGIIVRPKYS